MNKMNIEGLHGGSVEGSLNDGGLIRENVLAEELQKQVGMLITRAPGTTVTKFVENLNKDDLKNLDLVLNGFDVKIHSLSVIEEDSQMEAVSAIKNLLYSYDPEAIRDARTKMEDLLG